MSRPSVPQPSAGEMYVDDRPNGRVWLYGKQKETTALRHRTAWRGALPAESEWDNAGSATV